LKGAILEHQEDDELSQRFVGVQPRLLDMEGYIGGICITGSPSNVDEANMMIYQRSKSQGGIK